MIFAMDYSGCMVLNTPPQAVNPAPVRRGFFTPIVSLWPGSAKSEKEPARAKDKGRLEAVFKYLAAPLNRGEFERNLKEPVMAKTQSAHPEKIPTIPFAIGEAETRLIYASNALRGFMVLLGGYNESSVLQAEQIYCLLDPIVREVDAALDELRSVVGGVQ